MNVTGNTSIGPRLGQETKSTRRTESVTFVTPGVARKLVQTCTDNFVPTKTITEEGAEDGERGGEREQLKPMSVTLVANANAYIPLLLRPPSPPAEIPAPWLAGVRIAREHS